MQRSSKRLIQMRYCTAKDCPTHNTYATKKAQNRLIVIAHFDGSTDQLMISDSKTCAQPENENARTRLHGFCRAHFDGSTEELIQWKKYVLCTNSKRMGLASLPDVPGGAAAAAAGGSNSRTACVKVLYDFLLKHAEYIEVAWR